MGVSNIYVGKEDDSYFIDTQCDEEHLGQICDCNTIALVESKQEAIQIGIRESEKLRVPLMIEWGLTENMNSNDEKEKRGDIMQKNEQIRENVYVDTRRKLLDMLGESFKDFDSEQLIDYAVENVLKSVRGRYNISDVNLAIQRSIAYHLGRTGYGEPSINSKKETAEDAYKRLLDSQITYMVFEDPLGHYTHLTYQEKQKVKDYMMDDTHLWDFAPIAEFIYDNMPSTFQEQNYPKLGVAFRKELYTEGLYSDKIQYRLYQHYLLNFDYGMGNTPVCLDEFITNELESEDYLDSIDGIEL